MIKINIKKNERELLMFRCLWSKNENIIFEEDDDKSTKRIRFPPLGSIKVTQKQNRER